MSGRTSWYAHDVGLHRRGLWVEVGEEHGPGGVCVLHVLCARAGEQRDSGRVREGFSAIAREAFVTRDEAREVIAFAASIGLLDELQVDEDGRRFSVRVSGWAKDQEKGRAAWRKASQRASEDEPTSRDEPSATVTSHGSDRPVTPSPLHNTTPHSGGGTARTIDLDLIYEQVDVASNMLVLIAGFERGTVQVDELGIRRALEQTQPPAQTDWNELGRRIAAGRAEGRIKAPQPSSALLFVLKSLDGVPLIGQPQRPTRPLSADEQRRERSARRRAQVEATGLLQPTTALEVPR